MWRYKYFRYTLFRIPQCYFKCTAGPWHKHVPNFSCPAIRIFSISGRPILRFFLKFKNQKKLVITPNTHSTPILTLLIPVLHSFCFVDSFVNFERMSAVVASKVMLSPIVLSTLDRYCITFSQFALTSHFCPYKFEKLNYCTLGNRIDFFNVFQLCLYNCLPELSYIINCELAIEWSSTPIILLCVSLC